ncbi:uncharacterized protein PG986_004744 [Apiospora aurea]|uniref:Uncharacterized protein n=1 Tax=Apiospora aurea TaxID=335848 RepID=A0ABR1QP90_9PEZI
MGAEQVPGVTKLGNPGEYQFVIHLSEIPGLNRIALGIRDTATAMLIRIRLGGPDAVFCIHFPPNDHESRPRHHPYSTAFLWNDRAAATQFCCSPDPNFLTLLLAKALHRNLKDGEWQQRLRQSRVREVKDELIRMAKEASDYATQRCIISGSCGRPLEFTAARPIACSAACQDEFDKWPLSVRLSPLLRDLSVLDLLLSCLSSQITALIAEPLLNPDKMPTPSLGCQDPVQLLLVLDTFPPMKPGITLKDIVDSGERGSERNDVLSWLCSTFQGMIVSAPAFDQVMFRMPEGSQELKRKGDAYFNPKTYLLLNTNAQRQKLFEEQLAREGQKGGGSAAFHGTPAQNALSILCNGLKQNVNSNGHVWCSSDPFYTTYYMWRCLPRKGHQLLYRSWGNSTFKNQQLLFGLETSGPTGLESKAAESCPQDRLMVRHLFVIPAEMAESCREVQGGDGVWAQKYR